MALLLICIRKLLDMDVFAEGMCAARKGSAGRAGLVGGKRGGQGSPEWPDGWVMLVGKAMGCGLGRDPPCLVLTGAVCSRDGCWL